MLAHAFVPQRPPGVRPVSGKALGELLQMLVCQSVALLSPRWQAELGGRFAGRRVKAMPQRPANMAAAGHTTLRLAFPRCPGLLVLNRAMAGLLAEAPAPWPELLGSGDAGLLLLCLTPEPCAACGRREALG